MNADKFFGVQSAFIGVHRRLDHSNLLFHIL
jgi:hypothetical protein